MPQVACNDEVKATHKTAAEEVIYLAVQPGKLKEIPDQLANVSDEKELEGAAMIRYNDDPKGLIDNIRTTAAPGQPPPNNPCSFCEATGARMICAKCNSARYCSQDCQARHWPDHRKACREPQPEQLDQTYPGDETYRQSSCCDSPDPAVYFCISQFPWLVGCVNIFAICFSTFKGEAFRYFAYLWLSIYIAIDFVRRAGGPTTLLVDWLATAVCANIALIWSTVLRSQDMVDNRMLSDRWLLPIKTSLVTTCVICFAACVFKIRRCGFCAKRGETGVQLTAINAQLEKPLQGQELTGTTTTSL